MDSSVEQDHNGKKEQEMETVFSIAAVANFVVFGLAIAAVTLPKGAAKVAKGMFLTITKPLA